MRRNRMRWGIFFLSPWLIGLVLFQLLPILATFFLSFTDYNATKAFSFENFNFVGLDNYARLFTDPTFGQSLGVTLRFALLAVPLGLIVPLFFAVLLNSKNLLGKNIFRTLFYAPTVIPVVAGAMIFGGVLNAQSGWINLLLKQLGIQGPRWMADPSWALPALNLLSLWGVGNAMLILLASLQGVPTDVLEAATVDGANWFQRFIRVTVPMISPVIFYNITLGVINAFQYFVPAMLLGGRNGDPQGATLFYNLHFYREAFVFNEMGYASVLAIVLFVIVMIMTTIMFYWGQRQVYYAGAER
ncbi:MAG: sugar ABC transporter permease [Anaerolineae bacterium]|nr:sugar ABC transporter permease [Anaerolineae bacterium]